MGTELVPVAPPRTWLVGPGGEVERYVPPPPPARKLTSGQQHAVYRIALAHIARVFQEKGFPANCIEQSSTSIGFDAFGMDINVNIREPARVAYVTSVPGDSGQRRVIGKDMRGNKIFAPGPGVRFASDEIPCRYVAEVQVSRISSTMPIYVIIPDGEPEPVKYVVKNILMLIASMANDPRLQRAISTDTSDGQLKQLPDYLKRDLGDAFKMLDLPEHELKRLGV